MSSWSSPWGEGLSGLRGEWPSWFRRCSKNQKVPSSNPTRHSVGLRDPTTLRYEASSNLPVENIKCSD